MGHLLAAQAAASANDPGNRERAKTGHFHPARLANFFKRASRLSVHFGRLPSMNASNRRSTRSPQATGLEAVSELEIDADRRVVWLKGFGQIKMFRLIDTNGNAEHWATNKNAMTDLERVKYASYSWQIEQFHRGIKQFCLIERAQCRRRRAWQNHINLCLRAFLRIESHCHRTGISWFEAKTSIIRAAVRAYLANPLYSLNPTA
jgi:hypothetical protein